MVTFLVYILKSSFCLVLLYGFYRLVLASTTRFSLNRWVLIGGMLACLLLPFVSLELEQEPIFQAPLRLVEEWEQPVLGITEVGVAKISQEKTEYSWFGTLVVLVYLSGAAVVLFRWVVGYISLFHWISRHEYKEFNGLRWVLYDLPVRSFSWGRYIVMNRL